MIEQHDVRNPVRLDGRDGLTAVRRCADLIAFVAEEVREDAADIRIVVDDKDRCALHYEPSLLGTWTGSLPTLNAGHSIRETSNASDTMK